MLNYGKFFKLNNETSDLSKGITVFDYIWLRDNGRDDDSPEFPIYIIISKDSIDFHAHYYSRKSKLEKHSHNIILSLPVSVNLDVKDGLTGLLAEGFKTNFPRHNSGEVNYLNTLFWNNLWENKSWEKSDASYSTLSIFDTEWADIIKVAKPFLSANSYTEWYENEPINRFIRKLILDFMFDLEQTNVFQISPQYDYVSVKLKENYFFSALAAKANFYYWREIVNMEIKLIIENEDIDKLKNKVVYIEDYLKAKMQWENIIRSLKAEGNFNGYECQWFKDPEIEMNNVRGYTKESKATKKLDKRLFKLINTKKMCFTDNFIKRLKNDKRLSDNWQQNHYYLWHKGWQWIIIWRLWISIAAVWVTIILGSNLWGNIENIQKIIPKCWIVSLFCVILLVASFGWFVYLRKRSKVNFKGKGIKRLIYLGALHMTFLSFIYSALIGAGFRIFVFHKKSCCGEQYDHWKYWCGEQAHFYWVAVCLAVFIGVVIQSFMDSKSLTEEL